LSEKLNIKSTEHAENAIKLKADLYAHCLEKKQLSIADIYDIKNDISLLKYIQSSKKQYPKLLAVLEQHMKPTKKTTVAAQSK